MPRSTDVGTQVTGHDTTTLGKRPLGRASTPTTVLTDHDWRRPGVNPYLWSLYSRVEASGVNVSVIGDADAHRRHHDVVHLHWPESALRHTHGFRALLALLRRLAIVVRAQMRGTCVVWTAHNIGHHERRHPRLERLLLRALPWLLDHVIYLGRASREEVERRVPAMRRVASTVVAHGHYREAYDVATDWVEARHDFSIPRDATSLLFFGQIRPYKGVDSLVSTFAEWDRPDAVLTVAGAVKDPRHGRRLAELASGDDRIRLRPGRVDDRDVGTLFAAADLVVLPFVEVLNSGSALLALSCERRILLPATPVFEELRRQVGAGWIALFEPPLTPADLDDALARRPEGPRPDLSPFEWDAIAAATIDVYRRAMAGGRR